MNPGYLGEVLPATRGPARIDPAEMLDDPVASFRAIFERAPIGIGLVDRAGATRACNPMLEELFGYSEAELADLNFNNLTHPDDVEPNASLFAELLEGLLDRFSVDKRMFRRDGEMFWARVTASLIRANDGTPLYALGMLEDVSEHKIEEERSRQLLAELTEAQTRFKIAFENAPIGMDLTTSGGRFLQVNPALCELLGYSRNELLTMRWQDVTYPEDIQSSLDSLDSNLEGRGVNELRKRYVRKDGQVRWCRLNSQMVPGSDGSPLYMVSQIADVTREAELEEQLRHAQKMEAV
ncbi:MAG: PAS domain-containing protein, partial [Actinomycetota bacterium]